MKRAVFLSALVLLVSLQCKKEVKEDPPGAKPKTFESVIEDGGSFPPVEESVQAEPAPPVEKTEDGQRWRCVTTTYSIKDGAGGDGGFPMFNPNANVIYPGSLIQGGSLRKATPDVIAVDRAGGTISYDIIDGNQQSSFTVEVVKKSSITDAMNQIIGQSTGVVPANFNFRYTNIQSRRQFALEVKADYENAFGELEGYLKLNTNSTYTSYLVQLNQSYYTMSFDIPTNKDQLFAENVTPDDLAKYVGIGNPATYVSDVTYGRTYYMLIESTASAFDMEAGIKGSFSAIASSGGGSVDASYLSTLENLKIQVFAYGGEASATLRTVVDASTLDSLVNKLASAGDIRSGKPVSYVVRSVYDNKVVAVQLATEYDVTNCVPLGSGNTPPAATSHWADLVENFGAIGAAVNISGSGGQKIALFNKAGNRFMLSQDNTLTGPYNLADIGDGGILINAVSAGGFHRYKSGSTITTTGTYFWNENGNKAHFLSNTGQFESVTRDIGWYGYGNCPFNAQGITGFAFCNYSNNPYTMLVINKEGDQFSLYDVSKTSGAWSTPRFCYDFDENSTCPFELIGAVCYMKIGQTDYNVFFNKQGTQYCLWDRTSGFSAVYDL